MYVYSMRWLLMPSVSTMLSECSLHWTSFIQNLQLKGTIEENEITFRKIIPSCLICLHLPVEYHNCFKITNFMTSQSTVKLLCWLWVFTWFRRKLTMSHNRTTIFYYFNVLVPPSTVTVKITGPQTAAGKTHVGPVNLLYIIMFKIKKIKPNSGLVRQKPKSF